MQRLKYFAMLATMLTLSSGNASADLIVDVGDSTITASGMLSVDVLISSTGTDSVDLASYVFAITNVGAPSSTLQFVNPQLTNENTDANYIFAGDVDPGTLFFTVNTPAEVEGSDFTDSATGVTIDSTQRLLASLDVEHILGAGQTAAQADGEQFRITLLDVGNTFFEDENFNLLDIDNSSFDSLGVGGGLITVSEGAAVPEPNSAALALLALFAATTRRRSRRTQWGEHCC